jgi:hypothetical protein
VGREQERPVEVDPGQAGAVRGSPDGSAAATTDGDQCEAAEAEQEAGRLGNRHQEILDGGGLLGIPESDAEPADPIGMQAAWFDPHTTPREDDVFQPPSQDIWLLVLQ